MVKIIQKFNLLIVLIIFLLALAVIIILFNSNKNSTGMQVYDSEDIDELDLGFAVDAWRSDGWGECESQDATVAELNNFCVKKGYNGLYGYYVAPGESSKYLLPGATCYQNQSTQRYKWNGTYPMVKGAATGSGFGLTKVKCVKITSSESSGSGSSSSGCPQCTVSAKDACQKLCGCSS